ncbi:MAG: DEAD/DEAH box helicase family protein [Planctomycetota bacterium]|nr:DEAD/DEAH box helicase family protein [Planctomycetota bacterium]
MTSEQRLSEALADCERLREENRRLRERLGLPQAEASLWPATPQPPTNGAAIINSKSSSDEKMSLFRRLFHGREDVYATRWEGRDGKAGYSPACRRVWEKSSNKVPEEDRAYFPLTDRVIYDHLTGQLTVGVYPLLTDERCWFLAADFDKASWQEDVTAFLKTCNEWNVPAVLERSRSGKGGHVWMFFESALPASQARKLGAAILTRTMERRHLVGLDSYDRFFPSQDTMPKGGFGNLIALPLQHAPRNQGNSVFLNSDFTPFPDQWAYLSGIRQMRESDVDAIVREAERRDRIVGVRRSVSDDKHEEDPWTLPPSRTKLDDRITDYLPPRVRLTRGNLVYVDKEGLPSAMLNRLHRLAAFQNPEFYRAQAMRLSTFDKPRVIRCAEEFPRHVGLPRGCIDEVVALLKSHRVAVDFEDQRLGGNSIDVVFHGQLRPEQQEVADTMLAHDDGILCATTAFGKTVVAAWMIAARRVNTLILVHRRQLLDQWRERLATFLNVPIKEIGQIGGGQRRATGIIDVGIIQSLNRKQVVSDLVANYGHVIVDECHHLSAVSFEQVLRQVKARYVVGLTATPQRKDGHHPIIVMQCGPIRYRVDAKAQALTRPFKHVVIPRLTSFQLPAFQERPEIYEVYAALTADKARNDLIASDLLRAVQTGRSPILLTERTSHLDDFAARLHGHVKHIVILKGGMGAKQRRAVTEQLATIPSNEQRVLLATGRYVGEGFDDARLDTLFLALPISWRGTLQQYVGRLHRIYDAKHEVMVYDYVDGCVAVLAAMYRKRVRGYAAVGYEITTG